jgi:exopolysaccharide production negative regulator
MRTFDHVVRLDLIFLGVIGLALGVAPAAAFDPPRPVGRAWVEDIPRPPAPVPFVRTPSPVPAARPAPPALAPAATPVLIAPAAPAYAPANTPSLTAPTSAPAFAPSAPSLTPAARQTPFEAFRAGTQQLKAGKANEAVSSLEYAAAEGVTAARWKLGRMYAEGDGVPQSDLRAFEYFSSIANARPDEIPGTPQARFVASAFVALGHYYREGIPDSPVKADIARARQMYAYAASYFGDPDAQYHLGRLYLDGIGVPKDPRHAALWFNAAAKKGQYHAQAVLGRMLFTGEDVPRQAARGLMLLTLARDAGGRDEGWLSALYEAAFRQATDDERAFALILLERWLRGRRD